MPLGTGESAPAPSSFRGAAPSRHRHRSEGSSERSARGSASSGSACVEIRIQRQRQQPRFSPSPYRLRVEVAVLRSEERLEASLPLGRRRRGRKVGKLLVSRGESDRLSVVAAPGQVVELGDGVIKPSAGRRNAARVAGQGSARRFGRAALRSARGASVESAHEKLLLRAEHLAAGDSTRRLHLGRPRPSVLGSALGAAPELNPFDVLKASVDPTI